METIEDIVADMRKRFEPYAKSDSNDARYVAYLGYAEFADRIEAAVPNQPNKVETDGNNLIRLNAAKMREALENSNGLLEELALIGEWGESARGQIEENNAALSAPPRNCDLYLTPKDAMLAHLEEVYEGEKVEFGDYEWCEFFKWLFAEAKGDVNAH